MADAHFVRKPQSNGILPPVILSEERVERTFPLREVLKDYAGVGFMILLAVVVFGA
jgi:hypothetical protein